MWSWKKKRHCELEGDSKVKKIKNIKLVSDVREYSHLTTGDKKQRILEHPVKQRQI